PWAACPFFLPHALSVGQLLPKSKVAHAGGAACGFLQCSAGHPLPQAGEGEKALLCCWSLDLGRLGLDLLGRTLRWRAARRRLARGGGLVAARAGLAAAVVALAYGFLLHRVAFGVELDELVLLCCCVLRRGGLAFEHGVGG